METSTQQSVSPQPTLQQTTSPTPVPQSQSPNVVTIPVPVVPPEDIYTYVAVKGSLHAQDCSVFGLNVEETNAIRKRFPDGSVDIINGIMIKGAPIGVINSLSQLGYKVISSTGEAEIVWTLQREL